MATLEIRLDPTYAGVVDMLLPRGAIYIAGFFIAPDWDSCDPYCVDTFGIIRDIGCEPKLLEFANPIQHRAQLIDALHRLVRDI
jgi:hypothetical protein